MASVVDDAYSWCLQWQQECRIPGIAFVVTNAAATQFVGLSGVADRTSGVVLSDRQRWQIGSISKAFTGIALLQLESRGQLRLPDAAVTHLPWLAHLRPDVTLHHLLTHSAGLPTGSEWSPDSRLESAMQGSVGDPQPPGSDFHYSNCGFEILGDVVERVSGIAIDRYLEVHVLSGLGMLGASGSIRADDRARDVRGHRPPRDDTTWRGEQEQVPDVWFPSCTADGAIVATPDDMSHYLRFLLAGRQPDVLNGSDFERLSARHVVIDDTSWYGYGLTTTERAGHTTLGHSGGMVGMYADVRVDRRLGIGTCLMVNGHADVSEANRYLLDLLRHDADASVPLSEAPGWQAFPSTDDPSGRPEWQSYVGLYRSYNPWAPTLRVLRSGDELLLVDPVDGGPEPLLPIGGTRFRVGGPRSPDIVDFSVPVDGVHLRLDLSGCTYARVRRNPTDPAQIRS